MTAIPTVTVTPATAAGAYARVDNPGGAATGGATVGDFGGALERALGGVVAAGHDADTQAMTALSGGGNLTDVVTALSRAELALQSTVAIRDRVVQAYQDIMRMPI